MNFSEALDIMKDGGIVRREEWIEGTYIRIVHWYGRDCILDEGDLRYTKGDINEDILADDWEEVHV